MAEQEGEHRRHLELIGSSREFRERIWGLVFGFLISIFVVGCGTYAAVNGQPLAGGFIGTGGLVGLAAVFVYGARKKAEEKATEKEEEGSE